MWVKVRIIERASFFILYGYINCNQNLFSRHLWRYAAQFIVFFVTIIKKEGKFTVHLVDFIVRFNLKGSNLAYFLFGKSENLG